ncbi:MAG: B12-binding domain-containing protein [Burkholderiaceae bacterium]
MTSEQSHADPGDPIGASRGPSDRGMPRSMLAPLVSNQVLPTLSQRLLEPSARRKGRSSPVEAHVAELTAHVIEVDCAAAWRLCVRWHAQGGAVDDLVMKILCGCARQLGEFWIEDEIDFATCTASMTTLGILLRRIERDMGGRQVVSRRGSQVLLLPVPGEAHSFGSQVGAFYLRRRGFSVRSGVAETPDEVLFLATQSSLDVIGFSVATEDRLPLLAETLDVLRADTATARLPVFIGGSLVARSPEKIRRMNVDLILGDITSAPGALARLLATGSASVVPNF